MSTHASNDIDLHGDETDHETNKSNETDSMEMLKSNRSHQSNNVQNDQDVEHISATLRAVSLPSTSPKSRPHTVNRNFYLHPTESHIQTYKLYQAAKEHREDLEINKKQLKNRISLLAQEIEHAKRIREELEKRHELSMKIQQEKIQTKHNLFVQKQKKQRLLAKQRRENREKRAKHVENLKMSKLRLQQAKRTDAQSIYADRQKLKQQLSKIKEKELEQNLKRKYYVTKHRKQLELKKNEAKMQLLNNLRQEYVENVKHETNTIAKHEKAISKLETTEKELYEQFLKMQKSNEEFLKRSKERRNTEYDNFKLKHSRSKNKLIK